MLYWYIILECYFILLYCISILFFTMGQSEYQYIDGCKCAQPPWKKKPRASSPANHDPDDDDEEEDLDCECVCSTVNACVCVNLYFFTFFLNPKP